MESWAVSKIRKEAIIDEFPLPYPNNGLFNYKSFIDKRKSQLFELPISFSLSMSKVIVLGDMSVGKTSLIGRFAHDLFKSEYKATIGVDFYVIIFKIFNIMFNLQIWDTAGQERFRSIAAAYYRSAHAVVVVFDATNSKSMENVDAWMTEAAKNNFDSPFRFVVANKIDCLEKHQLQSIISKGTTMACDLKAEFWAVSAKSGVGVADFFRRIAALCFEKAVNSSLTAAETRLTLGLPLPNSAVTPAEHKDSCIQSKSTCLS